eukprot:1671192-Rhodomonas_salina.6
MLQTPRRRGRPRKVGVDVCEEEAPREEEHAGSMGEAAAAQRDVAPEPERQEAEGGVRLAEADPLSGGMETGLSDTQPLAGAGMWGRGGELEVDEKDPYTGEAKGHALEKKVEGSGGVDGEKKKLFQDEGTSAATQDVGTVADERGWTATDEGRQQRSSKLEVQRDRQAREEHPTDQDKDSTFCGAANVCEEAQTPWKRVVGAVATAAFGIEQPSFLWGGLKR